MVGDEVVSKYYVVLIFVVLALLKMGIGGRRREVSVAFRRFCFCISIKYR